MRELVRGGLSCALVRAWLGWFVDFDLRLAPQHLGNVGLEPQVRPRNIFDRGRGLGTPTTGRGWAGLSVVCYNVALLT
jgi:hypothetical protein